MSFAGFFEIKSEGVFRSDASNQDNHYWHRIVDFFGSDDVFDGVDNDMGADGDDN